MIISMACSQFGGNTNFDSSHDMYDNSSTHNFKQITRKKIIVEFIAADTNKNLSKWGKISEALFFFFSN